MKKPQDHRDQELLVYVSAKELALIKRAALVDDRSASGWARRILLAALVK